MQKKLSSTDRQLISPIFEVRTEVSRRLLLKFILHARGSKDGQRNSSLRHAGGIGSLSLKSDGANFEDSEHGCMTYRISVGNNYGEWLSHDFTKTPLLRCKGEWNFKKAVDTTTKLAKVRLEIATHNMRDQHI